MAEVKLTADLNEAIEQLAKKLGLAAEEIIPHYTRLEKVLGISWCLGGLLLATLPWLTWLIVPDWSSEEARGLWWAARMIFCVGTTWGGVHTIVDSVENIVAPKAKAIDRLLDQIT